MTDPICQALANCQITMTMNKLLNLVPTFRQMMEAWMRKADQVIIPANFTELAAKPTVVNHHNPSINVILQGEEILG